MDKIEKALKKLSGKERQKVKTILERLKAHDLTGLNIKKLKDRDDIFRVRSSDLRIIYQSNNSQINILAIERRNEKTYKNI
ncbi:hypothetical protein GW889_01045 [Candidatus Berkelbacteria bacterium]|uniref:Type II toxin-antitoxin system RelE/ParE family toxin n=1 Tax=Candidatus Berkelbacteria bacterium CG10_big_fil_rev_8_21_14_0_10_43_14 TaxID=1974515 RepID=A0A2M6R9S8_9BACT|nr:hypothetical protein [Candidatus Berkelbacteria bacterium]OIP06727.1 MAG: hypothetical protein AUK41_01710 [Candidatus Berkelbacteria bacterium CG2_30_43_20]PIS07283.1 MAG: hypothetical protein COT79_00115 [Candidatus Berkelbacteria bacterium CG10_big_fil_rev_8_21_14_0_10_43_14]PIU87107.1 MAG: hypothetical protein COS66_02660 [Candidatus Berkelbacteria bacterium CG06_land_8_20_14_3_00_43_10]